MKTSSLSKKRGQLIILIGPAASGKTTMESHLLRLFPNARHILSDTTRKPRGNEVQGQHYNFISATLFEERIAKEYYAEHEEVHGQHYGTPKVVIENTLENASLAISPIDYKGARKLMERYPNDAIPLFLETSREILRERLSSRDDITQEEIDRRMRTTEEELREAHTFPHRIDTTGPINYTLERVKHILRKYYGVNLDMECDECP